MKPIISFFEGRLRHEADLEIPTWMLPEETRKRIARDKAADALWKMNHPGD